jgi:hypothetical protein
LRCVDPPVDAFGRRQIEVGVEEHAQPRELVLDRVAHVPHPLALASRCGKVLDGPGLGDQVGLAVAEVDLDADGLRSAVPVMELLPELTPARVEGPAPDVRLVPVVGVARDPVDIGIPRVADLAFERALPTSFKDRSLRSR